MWPTGRGEEGGKGGRGEGGKGGGEGGREEGKGGRGEGGRREKGKQEDREGEGEDNFLLCVRISDHTYLCSCGDHSGVAALENLKLNKTRWFHSDTVSYPGCLPHGPGMRQCTSNRTEISKTNW